MKESVFSTGNMSFFELNPVTQAFLATLGTYVLTAIGTLPVLFFQRAPRRLMDALMGGAAGVMVAASCWSLLQPAIEMGGTWPAVIGLALGGLFIFLLDQWLPHLHPEFPDEAEQEGLRSSWRRAVLLMVAITEQALAKARIRRQFRADALDGDAAVQPRVFRDVHFAHPACADPGENTVGRSPWAEGHDWQILSAAGQAARACRNGPSPVWLT